MVTKLKSTETDVPEPPSRRERKRNETREKLFHAALQLIARNGFAATRVEEITEAADVAKGTFFNYFPSKEHLLMEFAARQVGKVEKCLEAARSGKQPLRKLLNSLAHELTEVPSRTPELARGMMASFMSNEEVRNVVCENIANRGRQVLSEIITIGQQRREIRTDVEAHDLARTFQQSMFGSMLLWSLDPAGPIAPVLDRTVELLWGGMKHPDNRRKKRT